MFGSPGDFLSLVAKHRRTGNSSVYVVLHSTNGVAGRDAQAKTCEKPFQIKDDIWICKMPQELRDAVYEACESPGFPPIKPHRQYGQLYTFAVFDGQWSPGNFQGSRDSEMNALVSCAQLVHQTTLGFANSARLHFDGQGKFIEAIPHLCRGITEQSFMVSDTRNWLSESECLVVRDLFYLGFVSLPDRVLRANWNLQHAFFQYFFEVRSLLIVTGLEALVHIHAMPSKTARAPGATKQFATRTTQLAKLLRISFDDADARYVYEHRSDIAHGRDPWAARLDPTSRPQQIELSDSIEVVQKHLKAEALLRACIIRAITDPAFASMFKDDAALALQLPL